MKKFMTLAGFETDERYSKKRYEHYRSFNKKNTIMMYIQVGVALTTVAIVCTGIILSK